MNTLHLKLHQDAIVLASDKLSLRLDLAPLYRALKQPSASFFEIETLIYEIEEFLEKHMSELKTVNAEILTTDSQEVKELFAKISADDQASHFTREQVEAIFNQVAIGVEHPIGVIANILKNKTAVVLLVFIREVMHHVGIGVVEVSSKLR